MKAYLQSVRIAPKKANLVAKMVRGMSVPDAVESLRRTNKKAARIIETLLLSAIANASHNDKQDAQMMVIKTIVVNQGQAYRRGMPKARGQQRPYRKFLSHISLTLGLPGEEHEKPVKKVSGKKTASQEAKNPVQDSGSARTKKTKTTPKKSPSAPGAPSVSSAS